MLFQKPKSNSLRRNDITQSKMRKFRKNDTEMIPVILNAPQTIRVQSDRIMLKIQSLEYKIVFQMNQRTFRSNLF